MDRQLPHTACPPAAAWDAGPQRSEGRRCQGHWWGEMVAEGNDQEHGVGRCDGGGERPEQDTGWETAGRAVGAPACGGHSCLVGPALLPSRPN